MQKVYMDRQSQSTKLKFYEYEEPSTKVLIDLVEDKEENGIP